MTDRRAPAAEPATSPVAEATALLHDVDEELPRGSWVTDRVARAVPGLLGLGAVLTAPALGIGSFGSPGPGLWPLVVGVLLVVATVVLLVMGSRLPRGEAFGRRSWTVVLAVGLALVCAFMFEEIGYEIPSLVLMVGWLRLIGHESWRTVVVVPLAAVAVTHLLFIEALGTNLPHLIAF